MKKNPFVHNLLNGLCFGAVVGVGLYLFNSPAEYTLREHLFSLLAAAIVGLFTGVVLGLIFYAWESYQFRKFSAFREALKAEGELILEEKVTRLYNGANRSGHLFLTDRALVFQSSRQGDMGCTLRRDAIASVQISDPRRCQITVTMADGMEETFTVVDPRAWFDLLGEDSAAESVTE